MKPLVDPSEVRILLGLGTDNLTDEESVFIHICIQAAHGAIRRHLKYDPVYDERTEFYPLRDVSAGNVEAIWDVTETQAYQRALNDASSSILMVRHIPLRSITSLKIDYDGRSGTRQGAFGSETAKVEGDDFWPNYDGIDSAGNKICRDGIIRSAGLWPLSPGSVKIVYYGGFKKEELRGQDSIIDASPIWDAALNEATRRFHQNYVRKKHLLSGFTGPKTSERLGDYSYSVDSALLQRLVGGNDLAPENMEKLDSFLNWGWMLS